jgi:membrane protein YdbS with pleckstrin-like domain
MTEEHDDASRNTDGGGSRDHSTDGSEWSQPWPSEQTDDTTGGDASVDSPGQSTPRPPADDGRSDGAEATDQTNTTSQTGADSGDVYVSRAVQGTDGWRDLGETRPETIRSHGDLSDEQLREYTTDERSLHALVQVQWSIRVFVGAVVAGLIGTWGIVSLEFSPQWGVALTGSLLVLGLLWVVLYYRRWQYQVRTDAIYLERGVVTHVRSLVPYVRIQHVDTKRSFVERVLGLSTLVVYTAGSRGADVTVPGLLPEEARDLQGRVKELAIEAEGDDAL